jgi:hypothetical protein
MTSVSCSFCAKPQGEVQRLIAGPGGVYVCEGCVALCVDALSDGGIALPTVEKDAEWEAGGGLRVTSAHVVRTESAGVGRGPAGPGGRFPQDRRRGGALSISGPLRSLAQAHGAPAGLCGSRGQLGDLLGT